ncbi:hypothetical protein VP01_526g6 [Puccinia sorghi]|uniref:Uncharacterized protein n=1 Tax=Puccinia sorghi TaxID=27349 RepID=A0A0L6UKF2_9BASI|nr:hypothetical protein VP01_526g6 [Puccinia sorghi]
MFTELDFVSVILDIEALHYFQNEYRTNPVRRTALLKEVFQYLALKDFSSPKHFEEWCRELEAACSPPNNPIQYSGLIIYGLQTLILQNLERGDLTALISPAVSRLTSTLRASQAQTPPDSTQRVWVQEMLDPESGLTSTLGTWNEFNIIIVSEKTLQRLRQAIALNEPIRVRLQLPIIEKIFSNPPPKNLSAHSRIAAIASLFHAMSMSAWQVQRDASSIAEKILAAENFFIFPYERRLLIYVKFAVKDYLGQQTWEVSFDILPLTLCSAGVGSEKLPRLDLCHKAYKKVYLI